MSIPPLSWHYASPKKCIDKWTTSDVKISLNDSYTIGEAPSYMHFIQYTCSMYMHLHVRICTCSYMYQVERHVISFIHHFNTPLQTLRVIQNYSLPPSLPPSLKCPTYNIKLCRKLDPSIISRDNIIPYYYYNYTRVWELMYEAMRLASLIQWHHACHGGFTHNGWIVCDKLSITYPVLWAVIAQQVYLVKT